MGKIFDSVEEAQQQNKSQSDQDISVHASLRQIKHKFLVMSGKGGVGNP